MNFTEKILILDGAMGTMLQRRDIASTGYLGNNDMLNLLAPDIIREIHLEYLNAGADIITTNTFNGNKISQEDYNCTSKVREINVQGAVIAKEAANEVSRKSGIQRYVAGSMGPTNKMLTLSADVNHPEYRPVDFDTLAAAYSEQASALIDGGVDFLLVETIFDLLNAKAALYAIRKISGNIPIMVSVSINDKTGRILSGHTLESVYTALSRYDLMSFGLNCSFGAKDLIPLTEQIAGFAKCAVSLYPNAGLPNEMGLYDEAPDYTASCIRQLADEGAINIAGGCCGTSPEHIASIKKALNGIVPRKFEYPTYCDNRGTSSEAINETMTLCGLEPLKINRKLSNFVNIGERTNVAGSAKFLKTIEAHDLAAASSIALNQIEGGATIIDINMDSAMLDGAAEMETFLRYINNDPDIAKVPYMIDSSHWETILKGLKNSSGKPIVNSISLKDGEEEFLRKATEIYLLGAAVIVMAFDENGQAVTFERKIEICQRAFDLLTKKASFAPEDIIFDVNILTVATGMEEHDNYAVDFIKAVKWIKTNLPGCKTSGGVSNISFAFRGNNPIREAMHSVFLYHAINAGLDMAIVNPSMLQVYDEIDPELLKKTEAVVLNTSASATDELVELAQRIKNKTSVPSENTSKAPEWRERSLNERLQYALIKGNTDYLKVDLEEAMAGGSEPVVIIEGPLMEAMDKVGTLFSDGKMFLPQVVKSAKAMKSAVAVLQPYIEARNSSANLAKKGKVLIATVMGDVHDIGKNIVSIVLSCNNIEVIDLGVMVDNNRLIEEAIRNRVDIIGVSGLITPSLLQMESICKLLEANRERIIKEVGHIIPLSVGGAATSLVHTAVKLATLFPKDSDNFVVYGKDASRTALIYNRLLSKNESSFIHGIKDEQRDLLEKYNNRKIEFVSIEEAREKAPHYTDFSQPEQFGEDNLLVKSLDINNLIPKINWNAFFAFWGFKGSFPAIIYGDSAESKEAEKLYEDAMRVLGKAVEGDEIEASLILDYFEGRSRHEKIVLYDKGKEILSLTMPRQLEKGSEYRSLADYFPSDSGFAPAIGLFALKIEDKLAKNFDRKDYECLLRHSLCARLAEAFAEWMQEKTVFGGTAIRPAFGYAVCPDHTQKRDVFKLLDANNIIGISLTQNCEMIPETSLCGMLIVHPQARYFDMKRFF